MLSVEGRIGIGKSFILYFLACYLLANDNYWISYVAFPSCDAYLTREELCCLSQFYYPEIMGRYRTVDFETAFQIGRTDAFDQKNVKPHRQYIAIVDQFNNLMHSYHLNATFISSIFKGNLFPRLIFSGSANNDLDLIPLIPRNVMYILNRSACNPRVSYVEACQIIANTLSRSGIELSRMKSIYKGYFLESVMAASSNVPLEISSLVRYLTKNPASGLKRRFYGLKKDFCEFRKELSSLISEYKKGQFKVMENDLREFQTKCIETKTITLQQSIAKIIKLDHNNLTLGDLKWNSDKLCDIKPTTLDICDLELNTLSLNEQRLANLETIRMKLGDLNLDKKKLRDCPLSHNDLCNLSLNKITLPHSADFDQKNENLKCGNEAIIFGKHINNANALYDKRYFYRERLDNGTFKILPIYDQAKYILLKLLKKDASFKLERMILEHIESLRPNNAILEILFENYYVDLCEKTMRIKLSHNCPLQLDSVVYFDALPTIDLEKNTLFVPVASNYGMYDFIVVAGSDSANIRVIFIQFTINEKIKIKLDGIDAKFTKFHNDEDDLSPLMSWLDAFACEKSARKFKFYKVFIHYHTFQAVSDFNMCSFGHQDSKSFDRKQAFEDLIIFLNGSIPAEILALITPKTV